MIDDDTKEYILAANNKPMMKNRKVVQDNINNETEKPELYKILKYMGESNPSATKKATIYKKLRDYYHDKNGKYI